MTEIARIDDLSGFLQQNLTAIGPQLQLIAWGLSILFVDFLLSSNKTSFNWRGQPVFFRGKAFAAVFALLGLFMSSLHLYVLWGLGTGPAFFEMYTLDSFTLFFSALFLAAGFLAVCISYRYLEIESAQHSEYYALILFAISGMMFLAGAIDLVTVFVGLELMSVSTYILVGFLRNSKRSNEAALKYFLLGAFSTATVLYGMSLLYGLTGATNLGEIAGLLAGQEWTPLVALSLIFMTAGFGFKIAAAPFHMWVPDAYEGAPTAITGFMSVAVKAAAFAVLLRFFLTVYSGERDIWMPVLAVLAMITMTWGNIAALTQQNTKRLLAYSSISHVGFVLMGVVAGGELGITASAVYLLAYTFMNLGIWTVMITLRRQDVAGEDLEDFNGLYFAQPAVAILMLIFLLSLAGIPPLAGFIAKYYVFAAVIQAVLAGAPYPMLLVALAVVGALNAVVSLYYYFRIVVAMFMKREYLPVPLGFSAGVVLALVITGLLTVLVGVYAGPFIDLARLASLPLT
jgi:NADH-quinone oxidoreductase subunit N